MKKKATPKETFLGCLGLIVIVIIISGVASFFIGGGDDETSTKPEPENKLKTVNDDKKPKVTYTDIDRQIVKDFEQSIYDKEASIKPIIDRYQAAMKGLSDGTTDINSAYSATNDAMKATKRVRTQINDIVLSDELPKEISKLLKDVKSELSTAYYSKSDALEYAMKYLDDQKPSDLQKYKDEISTSDRFLMRGMAKLFDIKTKVGIK